MIDFVTFVQQFGVLWAVALICFLALTWFVWRELKDVHAGYRRALQRIETIEESLRDKDNPSRIYCRWECLQKIDVVAQQVEAAKTAQEGLVRELASLSTGHLLISEQLRKTEDRK